MLKTEIVYAAALLSKASIQELGFVGIVETIINERKEMKKLVTEVENEGFMALLGKPVLVFCMNYIYTGTLNGVNDDCILLDDAKIVYNTGSFDSKNFEDAQPLPFAQYIQKNSIESFGETNKK